MTQKIKKIINELKGRVITEFHNKILDIIIFGSYARGEESSDSDLDILIITKEKTKEIEKKIFDIVYEIMWEYNFNPLLSVDVITKDYWDWLKNIESSFYKNIEKEGVKV